MSWNLRFGRRQWGLRGVQWNLDDFESMEDAIQAADALVEDGIYAHVTNTEAGPVILVSKRDLRAALRIVEPWCSPRMQRTDYGYAADSEAPACRID